jgi:hypothetical protein
MSRSRVWEQPRESNREVLGRRTSAISSVLLSIRQFGNENLVAFAFAPFASAVAEWSGVATRPARAGRNRRRPVQTRHSPGFPALRPSPVCFPMTVPGRNLGNEIRQFLLSPGGPHAVSTRGDPRRQSGRGFENAADWRSGRSSTTGRSGSHSSKR